MSVVSPCRSLLGLAFDRHLAKISRNATKGCARVPILFLNPCLLRSYVRHTWTFRSLQPSDDVCSPMCAVERPRARIKDSRSLLVMRSRYSTLERRAFERGLAEPLAHRTCHPFSPLGAHMGQGGWRCQRALCAEPRSLEIRAMFSALQETAPRVVSHFPLQSRTVSHAESTKRKHSRSSVSLPFAAGPSPGGGRRVGKHGAAEEAVNHQRTSHSVPTSTLGRRQRRSRRADADFMLIARRAGEATGHE